MTTNKKTYAWWAALIGAILLIGATIVEPKIITEIPLGDMLEQIVE